MYSEQTKLMEAQKETIALLTEALHTGSVSSAVVAASAQAARSHPSSPAPSPKQREASSQAAPASAEDEEDRRLAALMKQFEELQEEVNDAGSNELPPDLMATIGALIKEKNDLQQQLEKKQAALEVERKNLVRMNQ